LRHGWWSSCAGRGVRRAGQRGCRAAGRRRVGGGCGSGAGRPVRVLAAPGPPVCRSCRGWAGGGAATDDGVHRQAAGSAGCAGAGARRRDGTDHLLGGRSGVGGVSVARPSRASAQVSDRSVASEFVFDRHGPAELSVAYRILVPERRRRVGAGEEGRPPDEQRSDLRPGVLGPAEGAADDRLADRGAANPRRAARA
jgi:hypothetical protein